MKSIIYLTKQNIWVGEKKFSLDTNKLVDIFVESKKKLKVSEVRIVLGNEISFVSAVRLDNTIELKRAEMLRLAQMSVPFEISDACFDWDRIVLGEGDDWAQIIAVDPEVVNSLMEAVRISGIKVDWIIPVGVVVGAATKGKETCVLLKWEGQEKLSILAQKGLVDLVVADEDDEKINVYAKEKWNLAVNPEQINLSEKNFKFESWVWGGKANGEDMEILGIPMAKKPIVTGEVAKQSEKIVSIKKDGGADIFESNTFFSNGNKKMLWGLVLLGLAVVVGVGIGFVSWQNSLKSTPAPTPTPAMVITETPTVTATPTVVKPDLGTYRVMVQNSGGVTGEAGKVKNDLVGIGFENVNTSTGDTLQATTRLFYRNGTPLEVIDAVSSALSKYETEESVVGENLTDSDLLIVIGTTLK